VQTAPKVSRRLVDEHAQLRRLLDLAESLGIAIRRSPAVGSESAGGDPLGGALVRLRGQEILFLDPAASVADRIAVVASALKGRRQLEESFLPPEIRQLIDKA
jgi:hypothetical protein